MQQSSAASIFAHRSGLLGSGLSKCVQDLVVNSHHRHRYLGFLIHPISSDPFVQIRSVSFCLIQDESSGAPSSSCQHNFLGITGDTRPN